MHSRASSAQPIVFVLSLKPAPSCNRTALRSRHLVTHDWLWSVGAHPLSWTSTGTAYTQMHLDALHRCTRGWKLHARSMILPTPSLLGAALWRQAAPRPCAPTTAGCKHAALKAVVAAVAAASAPPHAPRRGYVVDALDETADLVNRGVALLADEKPSEGGYSRLVLQRAAARRALAAYAQCVDAWRAAVARAAALDFGGAAGLIDDMQRAAWAFLVECTKVGRPLQFAARRHTLVMGLPWSITHHMFLQVGTHASHTLLITAPITLVASQQLDAELHPQRCADRTPMAPGLLRALVAGSAAAVALTLALTCGVPRKAKAG